jgi:hypothetical protein
LIISLVSGRLKGFAAGCALTTSVILVAVTRRSAMTLVKTVIGVASCVTIRFEGSLMGFRSSWCAC